MKRFMALSVFSLWVLRFSSCLEADEGHEDEGKAPSASSASSSATESVAPSAQNTKTITGEVMDLACYSAHPDTGKGLGHAKCAQQCLEKGIPPGILSQDGMLYVALGADHGPANKVLIPHAGRMVEVQGQVREVNSVKFIEVKEVREITSASAPSAVKEEAGHSHEGHSH